MSLFNKDKVVVDSTPTTPAVEPSASELAKAIVQAIQASQPVQKKTISTYKPNNPWLPKDGSPRLQLKRKSYHHGIPLGDKDDSGRLTNEEIGLFNQLRPGTYCEGYVKVVRRRDKGIDIDYPIKTASQRLRLVNQFGIRSFSELLQTCITQAEAPKKDEFAAESDE